MEADDRKKLRNICKYEQNEFLKTIEDEKTKQHIEKVFRNLDNKFKSFIRCDYTSNNSLKRISGLSHIIFGSIEYQKQQKLENSYLFIKELEIINEYLKKAMDNLLVTKYNGKCPSYGEALLNCYLDLYITFTINDIEKEHDAHPNFLINPLTGSLLELDVLFNEFRLAFEFQGEHHYSDIATQTKDNIKISIARNKNHILIPVNIVQLSNMELSKLICNSIKEQAGLQPLVNQNQKVNLAKKTIRNYYLVIQRIYLANSIYAESLSWLDSKANSYILGRLPSSPISTSTKAPRINHNDDSMDMSVREIYKKIPQMRNVMK